VLRDKLATCDLTARAGNISLLYNFIVKICYETRQNALHNDTLEK